MPAATPPPAALPGLALQRLPTKGLAPAVASSLLQRIQRAEKLTFPTSEAFDFPAELSKRTTVLYAACDSKSFELYGYVVYVRSKLVTRIHKVCVVTDHRRKGVGRWMVMRVLEELGRGGAGKVDLWVDVARESARELYRSCGFEDREVVKDYYGQGRDAARMVIDLGL